MKCPICRKAVRVGEEHFPFCSERCRLIDLGNWSAEKYVISSPLKRDNDAVAETENEGNGDG